MSHVDHWETGTGKSEFLKDIIPQGIRDGQGVAVIDPSSSIIDELSTFGDAAGLS